MKLAILIFSVLLFVSCKQKPKEEVLDMNEIIPHSDRYQNGDLKHLENADTIDFGFDLKFAEEVGIAVLGTCDFEGKLFPDRFTPLNSIKLNLIRESDTVIYCNWTYKDSTQTKNAFYNWIDCFGPKCKSIKLGQNVNFQKDNFILLVGDTSLIYFSAREKLDPDDWLNYFILKYDLDDWKFMITQRTRGKAIWKSITNGKKEELNLDI